MATQRKNSVSASRPSRGSQFPEERLTAPIMLQVLLEHYRLEKHAVDQIYARGSTFLTAAVALGAALGALLNLEMLPLLFGRVDVFLYFALAASTAVLLAIAVYWLGRCFLPRSEYGQLASGEKLLRLLRREQETAESGEESAVRPFDKLLDLVASAQTGNAAITELRRKQLAKSIRHLVLASFAMSGVLVFHWILVAQGVVSQ